jgi:hypothetical protein
MRIQRWQSTGHCQLAVHQLRDAEMTVNGISGMPPAFKKWGLLLARAAGCEGAFSI